MGHAALKDIEEGKSTVYDRDGNERSDRNADNGVAMVVGRPAVVLGRWFERRHLMYRTSMLRIHKMIVAITLAEKEERARVKFTNKTVLGYDPECWIDTSLKIRTEIYNDHDYNDLVLPPPNLNRHK